MQGILALEDGTVFVGKAFGAAGTKTGEVAFYTGMTGYQELMFHPDSLNKIMVMTYPLIGNYGIVEKEGFMPGCRIRALIVREICLKPNHWGTSKNLPDYLADEKVIGISEIDTRALTRHLREHGIMRGVVSTENDSGALVELARKIKLPDTRCMVEQSSVNEPVVITGKYERVVVIDLGGGLDFARMLNKRNYDIVVVPFNTTMETIMNFNPLGVVFSEGPGGPHVFPELMDRIQRLAMCKVSLFGIGTGCHLLALAMGGKVDKMKFGHRGDNYPVKDLKTGRVYITSQNHGFVVNGNSLAGTELEVTHLNINDGTVEGFRHRHLPVFGMQFQAGAFSADNRVDYLLDSFLKTISGGDK